MHEYLSQHPNIEFPTRKEPKYFGQDLHFHRRLSKGEYESLFANIHDAAYTGESMVYKLFSKTAAEEIKREYPESKIIIMLRHPADFMHSLYYQNTYEAIEDSKTIEEALENEPHVKANYNDYEARFEMPHRLLYRENACFSSQISRYFKAFDSEQILTIGFNEFANNTGLTYNKVLNFLNLPPYTPDFLRVNEAKENRSLILRKLTKRPPKLLSSLLSLFLSKKAKQRINTKIKKINTARGKKVPLSPATRAQIDGDFKDEIQHIEDLTGINL
jgi:hypothetical protein